ncbi:MAG: hypothetical protein RL757_540 [Bacteroidota bacterium]|jgi:hypothetical protein
MKKKPLYVFFAFVLFSFDQLQAQDSRFEAELPPPGKLRVSVQASANYMFLQTADRTVTQDPNSFTRFPSAVQSATISNAKADLGGGVSVLLHFPFPSNPDVSVEFGLGLSRFRRNADLNLSRMSFGGFGCQSPDEVWSGKLTMDNYSISVPVMLHFEVRQKVYFDIGLNFYSITQPSMQKSIAEGDTKNYCALDSAFRVVRLATPRIGTFSDTWEMNPLHVALSGGFGIPFWFNPRYSLNVRGMFGLNGLNLEFSRSKISQYGIEAGIRYNFYN